MLENHPQDGNVGDVDDEPKERPRRKRRSAMKIKWDNASTWEKIWRTAVFVGCIVLLGMMYFCGEGVPVDPY